MENRLVFQDPPPGTAWERARTLGRGVDLCDSHWVLEREGKMTDRKLALNLRSATATGFSIP
jgi:hypothetical protein